MSLLQADRPITEVLGFFSRHGLEVGLLVPTETGLQKSIMDAHASLRDYLRLRGVHDYERQGQGPAAKRTMPARIVTSIAAVEATASLYRPETKSGDPRIWISRLGAHARAGNVLALIAADGTLNVVNASDPTVMATAADPKSPLGSLLARLAPRISPTAQELLGKLKMIAARGFVPSLRHGPTGVGYTLETLLGIQANSSRAPDYKGIELKASRTSAAGGALTRSTLFSKTPDWKASPYKRAIDVLQAFGRPNEEGRKQIYCEMNYKPNPTFGFYLSVEDTDDRLYVARGTPTSKPVPSKDEKVLLWDLEQLRGALVAKHRETFWVKAAARARSGTEEFHYFEVEHTTHPLPANFAPLVETGHIQLDFLLHVVSGAGGKPRARDHGYLFKIWPEHRELLFAVQRRALT